MRSVKALVAVVDGTEGDGLDEHPQEPFDLPNNWGLPPADGDRVGIPTPCARLRAGYWCTCGGSFNSVRGHIPMTRARVAMVRMDADGPDAVPYIDGPPSSTDVPVPTDEDRSTLRQALDRLDVGTVVERNGLGFAPLYRPVAARRTAPTDWGTRW